MVKYHQNATVSSFFSKGQSLSYTKGEIILGNSKRPDGVYYIKTGYVKVYSIGDDGTELLHIVYGPGEIFPIVWAYLGVETDSIFYEAVSDCTFRRLARFWFTNHVTTDMEVSHALAVQLAQQLRMYSARVNNLEYKKAAQRVAYRLLVLVRRFGNKSKKGIAIDPPLTHEVFASSINLTRESFSREIEKLADQKIIERENHRIIVTDMDALAELAGRPNIF